MKFNEHLVKKPRLLLCEKCQHLSLPGYCTAFKKSLSGSKSFSDNKKCKQCLILFRKFHDQLTQEKKPKYDNRPCYGSDHDWARYDKDDNARSMQ